MTQRFHVKSFIELALTVIAGLCLVIPAVNAQTPPTPTTTFNEGSDNLFTNPANWDVQVPVLGDDALIDTGETAFHDLGTGGIPLFGSLTLGTNATFQFQTSNFGTLAGNANQWSNNPSIYFNDGSHLEMVNGLINSDANYYVLPGATATFTHSGNGSKPRGTLNGSGNLNVVAGGTIDLRWDASAHSGNLTFSSSNGGARQITIGQFGASTVIGSGTNTLADAVFGVLANNNRIHDSATLRLVGGSSAANAKFDFSTRTEIIRNLIIESPTGTASVLRASTGVLMVSNTVTFQGTAGTVEIDDSQATPAGNKLVAGNLTFGGTGNWTVQGDATLRVLNGGVITTDANAAILNPLNSNGDISKAGNGVLTLNNTTTVNAGSGLLTVSAGTLAGSGTISGSVTVNNGATLSPGNSVGIFNIGNLTLASNANFIVELNGLTVGTEYDQANVTGTVSLGDANLVLSLGFTPSPGDTFTIIENDSNDAVTGTFLGLPEDGYFGFASTDWRISYVGGTGNDVVLTVIPEPSSLLLVGASLTLFLTLRRRSGIRR